MDIIVGKLSGFCNGVKHTIEEASNAISKEKVFCLGEIVHNERVIKDLEQNGMITVDDIEKVPNNSKLIIRAHGEEKKIYDRAKEKELEVIDLTCGNVKLIRNKVSEKRKDSFIVILGKNNHPETKGVISFAGENSIIIENEEDIEKLNELLKKSNLNKIYIVSQTTFNNDKFDKLVEIIKNRIDAEIEVNKTICNATSNRQKETIELSKNVDIMIIIGGKHSSNTKELEVVSRDNCSEVYLINDVEELKEIQIDKNKKIGIMAGASTPNIVVEEVINYLNSL